VSNFDDLQSVGLETGAWLAAIIESSDDAIISKTLDGVITSWNGAAQQLFGYSPAEAIGQSITIIIPEERLSEESTILAQIRLGERVEHFETIRRGRDGKRVHVSVTVSPVRDADGQIQGASKILRDITDRKRADERQTLLLREMDHRIKNLFAVTVGLVALSARGASNVDDLAEALQGRIGSLARAHALTLPDFGGRRASGAPTPIFALLGAILGPFSGQFTIELEGEDLPVGDQKLSSISLMLHEMVTNAAKYGALSVAQGRLSVRLSCDRENLRLVWTEAGGPRPSRDDLAEGFGSKLEKATIRSVNGTIEREWREDGLTIVVNIPAGRLA
jgi:PAS domain S-box-containing protein